MLFEFNNTLWTITEFGANDTLSDARVILGFDITFVETNKAIINSITLGENFIVFII